MATTSRLEVHNADTLAAIRGFLKKVLEDSEISALFVPLHMGGSVMPSLVTDPAQLDRADPLAPSFPLNAARHVARLTRGEHEGSFAAVMRPCEIRAFVELVKLNQGTADDLVIIGVDCHGAHNNRDYHQLMQDGANSVDMTRELMEHIRNGRDGVTNGGTPMAKACQACEHPTPRGADLTIGLFGVDWEKEVPIYAQSPSGEGVLNRLGFSDSDITPITEKRRQAVDALVKRRGQARDAMFEQTRQKVATPALLSEYLQDCVNCYNCRVACPVCYCKECVFNTDVFEHEPWQYLGWAKRKGALRMPVDRLFFHLTRLAHSSIACVGCGQCSNACPNDIPVMELFRLVGAKTQQAFGYEAGRSLDESPPLSVFQREEFAEVTGGAD